MAAPPGPSAPPANMFDTVPGYEGTVAGGGGKTHAEYVLKSKADNGNASACAINVRMLISCIQVMSEISYVRV